VAHTAPPAVEPENTLLPFDDAEPTVKVVESTSVPSKNTFAEHFGVNSTLTKVPPEAKDSPAPAAPPAQTTGKAALAESEVTAAMAITEQRMMFFMLISNQK
jgi:hypothetical protein